MRTTIQRYCAAIALVVAATTLNAQSVTLSVEEYQQMKQAGTLPSAYNVRYSTLPAAGVTPVKGVTHSGGQQKKGGGSNGVCNCWIEPDSDYTLAMGPNDDLSSTIINLPFERISARTRN